MCVAGLPGRAVTAARAPRRRSGLGPPARAHRDMRLPQSRRGAGRALTASTLRGLASPGPGSHQAAGRAPGARGSGRRAGPQCALGSKMPRGSRRAGDAAAQRKGAGGTRGAPVCRLTPPSELGGAQQASRERAWQSRVRVVLRCTSKPVPPGPTGACWHRPSGSDSAGAPAVFFSPGLQGPDGT